jgi:hypothetical protein
MRIKQCKTKAWVNRGDYRSLGSLRLCIVDGYVLDDGLLGQQLTNHLLFPIGA